MHSSTHIQLVCGDNIKHCFTNTTMKIMKKSSSKFVQNTWILPKFDIIWPDWYEV